MSLPEMRSLLLENGMDTDELLITKGKSTRRERKDSEGRIRRSHQEGSRA
jgi:hypothetical protein